MELQHLFSGNCDKFPTDTEHNVDILMLKPEWLSICTHTYINMLVLGILRFDLQNRDHVRGSSHFLCMFGAVYVYIYVSVYACMYVYTRVHVHGSCAWRVAFLLHVWCCLCVYLCICVCMYVHTRAHVHGSHAWCVALFCMMFLSM